MFTWDEGAKAHPSKQLLHSTIKLCLGSSGSTCIPMYTVQGTNPRSLSLKTPCKFAATRFDGTFFQYKHQNRWVYPSMAENLNMSLSSQNRQFQEFQPPPFLNIPGDKTVLLLDRASRKLVSLDQWHRWLDLSWTLMCHWVTLESSSFCTTVRCKEARCQLRPSFYFFFGGLSLRKH